MQDMLDAELSYYLNKNRATATKEEMEIRLVLAKQKIDELIRMTVEEHVQIPTSKANIHF